MPLYDVTGPKVILVKPEEAESYEVIQAVKRKSHARTFNKIVKTVDDAVEWAMQDKEGKLVWTRSAALFGHSSMRPLKDVEHLWDNIVNAVGDDKECKQAVGGFLRWRISLQEDDIWLVYRSETDEIDPQTGKKITISEYWINNDFNPKKRR